MGSRLKLVSVLAALSTLFAPSFVVAQDAEWDFASDPSKDLAVVSVEFAGGAFIAIQCQTRQLNVIFGGVPEAQTPARDVLITRADGATREAVLFPVEGSSLFRTPLEGHARFLRAGGQTTIISNSDDPRPFRMELALPTDPAGVNSVLISCGLSLSDDRDALPDVSHLLTTFPAVEMAPFSRDYTIVRVELTCLVSAGRLSGCRSERETPHAPEVGAATAQRANGRRLAIRRGGEAEAEGGRLELVVTGNRIYR